MTTVEQDVTVRPASAADRPSVLALLDASLGWESDDRHADFFSWKHERNPFGPSPAWVAVDRDGRLLGFRAFLRWEFTQGSTVVRAARAVDTATRPDVQRRGIFSKPHRGQACHTFRPRDPSLPLGMTARCRSSG